MRSRLLGVGLVLGLLLTAGCGARPGGTESPSIEGGSSRPTPGMPDKPRLGGTRSGLAWHSGIWLGGDSSTAGVQRFEAWLGRPADAVTTYAADDTFQDMADSSWHITTFDGFEGRLVYGVPLLPEDKTGSLAAVGRGDYDWVWHKLAKAFVDNGRGDSIIRIGLEGNGFGWGPGGADQKLAADYRAAFRRVAEQMRSVAPDLVIDFDIACGVPLTGGDDRLDALTELYPGDDVVDIIGCDIYDSYTNRVARPGDWQKVARPPHAPGPDDVADFARKHDKLLSIPEWGVWKQSDNGGGDNPVFISAMHAYMIANADILAYENYFDEPDAYIENSLFRGNANVKSGAEYRKLFGPS